MACRITKSAALFLLSSCLLLSSVSSFSANSWTMVEGHSVHRVASLHRSRLVGKSFTAWSPNGRFTQGAASINGQVFSSIEAVGKNLFAFFGREPDKRVCVHIHFGMAGNWAVYETNKTTPPEPTDTNRLRLEGHGLVADLSAMTVQHGGMDLYAAKRAKLGEDPLRKDADPEKLWELVQKSNKSIGALIMDQSYFTGPGNIYRAEILFKAGVHPDRPGKSISESEFKLVWHHTVSLLQRGFETGSILTVDPEEAKALGNPRLRRYIYNQSHCPRCGSNIKTWQIASRTCYACLKCQPRMGHENTAGDEATSTQDCVPFHSHCAPEPVEVRLKETGPGRLTVKEIKIQLAELGITIPSKAKKAQLVDLLQSAQAPASTTSSAVPSTPPPKSLASKTSTPRMVVSPEEAAMEKAMAGESLAVEHIAELAPGQAREARTRASKRKRNNVAPFTDD